MKKFWSLITVFFIFLSEIGPSPTVVLGSEEGKINAQITGKIINLKEANNYIFGNSVLILVHTKEKISIGIHASGASIMLPSNNRTQDISDTGVFTFKSATMEPGKYRIFVQPVKGFTLNIAGHDIGCTFIAIEGKDEAIEINIPAQQDKKPAAINLGNVSIYIPKRK